MARERKRVHCFSDLLGKLLEGDELPERFQAQDVLALFPEGCTMKQVAGAINYAQKCKRIVGVSTTYPRTYMRGSDVFKPVPKEEERIEVALHGKGQVGQLAEALVDLLVLKVTSQIEGYIAKSENRLHERLMASLSVKLLHQEEPQPSDLEPKIPMGMDIPEFTPKPRKTKVLVVGLLPRQQKQIRSEFQDMLDLRFAKDQVLNLRDKAMGADVTIGMIGFMSHVQNERIISAGGEYHKIHGGLSMLRDKLTEICDKQTTPA